MKAIRLKTQVPGPNSRRLMKAFQRNVPKGVTPETPVFVARAENALLQDVDGNVFIDFLAGYSAVNSGHCNPAIEKAIHAQVRKFIHTCFTAVPYAPYLELARKLNGLVPIEGPVETVFCNTGAEAIENAVKIARRYTGRPGVVSFEYGFHGRTLLALSLTSNVKPYKHGFGPFAPETYKLHYPYVYRRPAACQTEEGYVEYLLEEIEEEFFKGVVEPEEIACVVMEPVAGEGGFIVPPKEYVRGLARICRREKILLVADEVQAGFGRTGKMFGMENFGVKPDIVTMAKSLSNGLPLAAVSAKRKLMQAVQRGGFGGTFSGNPVSCAAALKAVDFIRQHKLPARANAIGKIVRKRFDELKESVEPVGDVRGLGAMNAMEIVADKRSRKPARETAERISRTAWRNGLIVVGCGLLGHVIRATPPLTIPMGQLHEGLDVLEYSVRAACKQANR